MTFLCDNGRLQEGDGVQESRLFKIVYELLDKGQSTAPALAQRFEVSVRTIYRDIDAISSAGIPIYATQGKGGGIRILDNFVLDRSLLSRKEQEQILMALQGLSATEGCPGTELLTKLGCLFQARNANWIEVDFSDWFANKPGEDSFHTMKSAIFGSRLLTFQYYGANGESTARRVEPLKLVFKSKAWYLYAFCLQRQAFRFFKCTRMKELQIQEEVFSREIPSAAVCHTSATAEQTIPVTLRFDSKMAFRVYDEFTDTVVQDSQGHYIVQTDLPDSDFLYSYLFSFGDSVEVLEPEAVRKALKEKLAALQKKYET